MKNGSIGDQLKMQERELIITDDSTSGQQQVDKSVNQSLGLDNAGYLLSIFPLGEDVAYNADAENERLLRKSEKKKKQRILW